MIVDKLENSNLYTGLSAGIAKAFEILKDPKLTEMPDGRYEVDGDNLYYLVQRYKTKPVEQCKLEAHKKYTDIQFAAKGQELIGYAPLDNLAVSAPYDNAKDVAFYKPPEKISMIKLQQDMFCILFPHDTHMPKCCVNNPSDVHKVVVKVKVAQASSL